MTPVLRPYRRADGPRLDRIDAGLTAVLGPSGPGWHDAAAAAADRVHLVLDDGQPGTAPVPVGYLVLAAPRGPEPGVELHRIVVGADRRGRGLGRALLGAALDLAGVPRSGAAREPGAPRLTVAADLPDRFRTGRVWLEVAPGNTAALALYRSAGLTEEARLPSVPGDPGAPPLRLVLAAG